MCNETKLPNVIVCSPSGTWDIERKSNYNDNPTPQEIYEGLKKCKDVILLSNEEFIKRSRINNNETI